MSTANPTQATTQPAMTSLFALIQKELTQVEDRLQQELRHSDPFIDELAQHSFRFGGKRLRPALLLLTAKALGQMNEDHLTLATVVEMIHTATLVHDDILDEADIRRHEDTVNARWNNQTSVLLGDYLFTHAFYLASSLETTFGCRTIGQATNTVCEGELLQTAAAGKFTLSREGYFAIIEAKTAALCACCCQLGAHYSGGDKNTVESFRKYGQLLGIAFQIADDLLDLVGEEQTVGKSLGTDLAKHRMTLPLIELRDQLNPQQQQQLQHLLTDTSSHNTATLIDWLQSSGALQQAQQQAANYAQQAAEQLTEIPNSPAKNTLIEIAQASVSRHA